MFSLDDERAVVQVYDDILAFKVSVTSDEVREFGDLSPLASSFDSIVWG